MLQRQYNDISKRPPTTLLYQYNAGLHPWGATPSGIPMPILCLTNDNYYDKERKSWGHAPGHYAVPIPILCLLLCHRVGGFWPPLHPALPRPWSLCHPCGVTMAFTMPLSGGFLSSLPLALPHPLHSYFCPWGCPSHLAQGTVAVPIVTVLCVAPVIVGQMCVTDT